MTITHLEINNRRFLKIYPPRYRKKNTLSVLKEELPNQNKRPFGVIFKETIGENKVEFSPYVFF